MSIIYVQFTDDTESVIATLFYTPEDPQYWPNQGVVKDSDPRYLTFYNTLPEQVKLNWPNPTVDE